MFRCIVYFVLWKQFFVFYSISIWLNEISYIERYFHSPIRFFLFFTEFRDSATLWSIRKIYVSQLNSYFLRISFTNATRTGWTLISITKLIICSKKSFVVSNDFVNPFLDSFLFHILCDCMSREIIAEFSHFSGWILAEHF